MFNFQCASCELSLTRPLGLGGLKWTRTTDLTIISRVLDPAELLARISEASLNSTPSPGGDEEDRTPDPLRAKQVLSQLSYTPVSEAVDSRLRFPILKVH